MTIVSDVVLFFLIWWTVLFAILPFGNVRAQTIIAGHAGSAPAKPRLRAKMIATTIAAIVLWWPTHMGFTWIMDNARHQADIMVDEDHAREK